MVVVATANLKAAIMAVVVTPVDVEIKVAIAKLGDEPRQ
jgi:hypothetical protein